MDEVQETLYKFAARGSNILHEYFEKVSQYFNKENSDIPIEHQVILRQLPISCHLTSESSLILIGNLRLWDNEMLIRSILEGTIKFIYLTIGTEEDRSKKIEEFWTVLPQINEIKRTRRAKGLLEHLPEPQHSDMRFIADVILEDHIISELERKFPRKLRKELEHRWSYSEIVKQLSSHELYKMLNGLFHSYGIGSHLIHQDADAINFIIDHNRRNSSCFGLSPVVAGDFSMKQIQQHIDFPKIRAI